MAKGPNEQEAAEADADLIEAAAAIIREWAATEDWSARDAARRILALYRRPLRNTSAASGSPSS